MRRLFRICICALSLFLFGCSGQEEDPRLGLIRQGYSALNNRNIEAYLNSFDRESPIYLSEKETSSMLFKIYELKYEVTDLSLKKKDQNTAEVIARVSVKKIRGPEFQNNIADFLFILKRTAGIWKIEYKKALKIDFI